MSEITELALIPEETALQVFTTEGAILPYLERIKEAVSGTVPDLTTKKGRDAIASIAYKVAQSKTYLESVRKRLADEQKEIPRKIDATGRLIKETLDALRDEVRKPLTDWEAEQARIEREAKERAERIQVEIGIITPPENFLLTAGADDLQASIDRLSSAEFNADKFGDRLGEACLARTEALGKLQVALEARQRQDAEQAELAELRRQKAEREEQDRINRIAEQAAAEASKRVKEEAEASVRAAEDATLRAQQEAQRQQQESERLLKDAEERAAAAADQERKRIEEENRIASEEASRRAADREHRAQTNAGALASLMAAVPSLSEEQAKAVIIAIVKAEVQSVVLMY